MPQRNDECLYRIHGTPCLQTTVQCLLLKSIETAPQYVFPFKIQGNSFEVKRFTFTEPLHYDGIWILFPLCYESSFTIVGFKILYFTVLKDTIQRTTAVVAFSFYCKTLNLAFSVQQNSKLIWIMISDETHHSLDTAITSHSHRKRSSFSPFGKPQQTLYMIDDNRWLSCKLHAY